jgi:hypothetical protein
LHLHLQPDGLPSGFFIGTLFGKPMRRFILINLLACGSALAQQPDTAWQAYAEVQLWAAYDAIPLRQFDGTWGAYAPRDGRNVFLQRNRAEIGVEKDGWRVGLEYRVEGTLVANRDTLDFYHAYQQRLRPDTPRAYALDAQFKAWSAAGLRVARAFALDGSGAALTVSGALYAHPRNRNIDVNGKVDYQPVDNYGFNAQYRESDTRYRYPFMPEVSQSSSGASVSMALQWPLGERVTANLALNDLWSRMHWANLPSLTQNLNSNVTSIDQDGYVNYRPLLTFKNSRIDKSGSIGMSSAVSLTYRLELWRIKAEMNRIEGTAIPALAATYNSNWGAFTGSYESRFKTVGIGYDHGPFRIHLRTNSWSLNQASAIGLDAGLHYQF